jgi:peptidoglycan/xylan/chitin deacetylase (PgdA/CDA1 family)
MKPMKVLRAVPRKREFAAKVLQHVGVLAALECATAVWNPALTVLTYHRIADPETNAFYDPVISATPDLFRTQMHWLGKHTCIISLADLIERAQKGRLWHEPTVLVTFDDGYRDNFEVAVPILAEYGVPATFFIPTAFLEQPQLPWWDYVAYVIKQTKVPRFTLERNRDGRVAPLEINVKAMSRTTAIMTIIRAFLDQTVDDEHRFLEQLLARAEVTVDTESLGRSLFMSWDQARQLSALGTGFTIGSHAHSHRNLGQLDDDSQRFELTESKQILETRIGHEVKALAYPYGWLGTYTKNTKATAAEAGYHFAFTSRKGVSQAGAFDPLEISRLGVGSGDAIVLLRARMNLHAAFGNSVL